MTHTSYSIKRSIPDELANLNMKGKTIQLLGKKKKKNESFHNLAKADTGCLFPKRERGAPMCGGALAAVSSRA